MSTRIALCHWFDADPAGIGHITDVIAQRYETLRPAGTTRFSKRNFRADNDVTGRPARGWQVSVIRSDCPESEWQEIYALPTVQEIPRYALDTLLADIPTNILAETTGRLNALGVTGDVYQDAVTWGDLWRSVLQHLSPRWQDFGDLEAEDFGT